MRRTLAFLALLALPVQAAQDPWASIKQGLARVCGYTDVDYICETYHLITTAEFYAKHFREGWTDLLREETEAWLQDAARTILNEGDPNGEVAQTLRELRSRLSEGYYQARATVRRLFREARLSRIRRIAQESGLGEENPAGASGSLVQAQQILRHISPIYAFAEGYLEAATLDLKERELEARLVAQQSQELAADKAQDNARETLRQALRTATREALERVSAVVNTPSDGNTSPDNAAIVQSARTALRNLALSELAGLNPPPEGRAAAREVLWRANGLRPAALEAGGGTSGADENTTDSPQALLTDLLAGDGPVQQLLDEAKTAVSTREVTEVLVRAVTELMKLQVQLATIETDRIVSVLQQQALTNEQLARLVEEEYKAQRAEAEQAMQEYLDQFARAYDEALQYTRIMGGAARASASLIPAAQNPHPLADPTVSKCSPVADPATSGCVRVLANRFLGGVDDTQEVK